MACNVRGLHEFLIGGCTFASVTRTAKGISLSSSPTLNALDFMAINGNFLIEPSSRM